MQKDIRMKLIPANAIYRRRETFTTEGRDAQSRSAVRKEIFVVSFE
jgi:hypothetical protein